MKAAKDSLEEYVANYTGPIYGRCWACSIPERAEVDAARSRGIMPHLIRAWLIERRGYTKAQVVRIGNHFDRGHHER